jgi:glycosyltransferase involved in cell wall biosynthesis
VTTSTVVVCAYTMERWDEITAAVDSVLNGTVGPDQVLVVVDHNDELLERATQQFTRDPNAGLVTVVANHHKQGLSGARNTAIELATSDVVVFLDDDAAAEPSWLARLMAHYDDESVVGVGGSARPLWGGSVTGTRPSLYPAPSPTTRGEFDWVVGCTYEGQPTAVAPVRNLMGCNMSFRRSAFDLVGGFHEDLGRVGKVPLGCEETEFCIRLRRANPGSVIVFDPAAEVRHHVGPARLRWHYLVSRCYAEGISKAAVAGMVGSDLALESERAYATRVLPRGFAREVARAARGSRESVAGASAIVVGLGATTLGYLRGRASLRRASPA